MRQEAEATLNQRELREFESRIGALDRELTDKQNEIERVETEKRKIEEIIDPKMDLDIDLRDEKPVHQPVFCVDRFPTPKNRRWIKQIR